MLAEPLSPAHNPNKNLLRADGRAVQWAVSGQPIPYDQAVAVMEARVAAIAAGQAPELIWLLEHPAVYTAGVSARDEDLLVPDRFPVHRTGRGGQFTYHGPGQRVAYVMLDLNQRDRDVRGLVRGLEQWLIAALRTFGVEAGVREGRVGVWVERKGPAEAQVSGISWPQIEDPFAPTELAPAATGVAKEDVLPAPCGLWRRDDKIAAIGVKVRKWVTFHGISLNVEPDLDHFAGIVPCGISEHGVTSLVDLGVPTTMDEADAALKSAFIGVFGAVTDTPPPV